MFRFFRLWARVLSTPISSADGLTVAAGFPFTAQTTSPSFTSSAVNVFWRAYTLTSTSNSRSDPAGTKTSFSKRSYSFVLI